MSDKKRLEELQKAYSAQLQRKDQEIEDLRKQNDLLMKTAMKQSEKASQWQELAKKVQQQSDKKED